MADKDSRHTRLGSLPNRSSSHITRGPVGGFEADNSSPGATRAIVLVVPALYIVATAYQHKHKYDKVLEVLTTLTSPSHFCHSRCRAG